MDNQLALELEFANNNLNEVFESNRAMLTNKAMNHIYTSMSQPYDSSIKGMDDVHAQLEANLPKLEDFVFSMITLVLTKREVNLQALVGTCFTAFKSVEPQRNLKAIEFLLMGVAQCDYITIERRDDYMYFISRLELTDAVLAKVKNQGFVLPMLSPPKATSNKDIGYLTFDEHVITGGKLKQHDHEICLDHINRVNQVAYRYEPRLGYIVAPKFSPEPKVKDNGELETAIEVTKRHESFLQLHEELPAKIRIMNTHGNRFFIPNKYCTRLRTYSKAHHFNYRGTKYIKAMVHLHDTEITKGEF